MNLILRPWLDKGVDVYLDDIIIYSKNFEKHVKLLNLILVWLAEHKLFVKYSKSKFKVPTIDFSGYNISASRVLLDTGKVESIILRPIPTYVYDILEFLGMTGYYSHFAPQYAEKATTLTDSLNIITMWEWSTTVLESFELLKLMLSISPILLYPRFYLPLVYSTNTSIVAIGATLL